MVFPYKVKHNGITYPAGSDVPVFFMPEPEPKAETPKVEEKPKPKSEPKKRAKR